MTATILSMLLTHAAPQSVPAEELAAEIMHAAEKTGVDAILLTRVVLVESRGVPSAYNRETIDHGLMQINERTRISAGITPWCVKQWRCNLHAGAKILAGMLRMRNGRECVYNLGPKGRLPQYEAACKKYEAKLASL